MIMYNNYHRILVRAGETFNGYYGHYFQTTWGLSLNVIFKELCLGNYFGPCVYTYTAPITRIIYITHPHAHVI